jgi:hypothetical protein
MFLNFWKEDGYENTDDLQIKKQTEKQTAMMSLQ